MPKSGDLRISFIAFIFQPDTPTQLEDLNEVIEEDTGVVPFGTYANKTRGNDSGYGSLKRPAEKEVCSVSISHYWYFGLWIISRNKFTAVLLTHQFVKRQAIACIFL